MKRLLIICLFISAFALAQSIEDLKKLEELKKQIDSQGLSIPKTEESKVKKSKSLVQFQDAESTLSVPAKKVDQKTKAVTGKLPIFGMDVFSNAKFDLNPEIYGPVNDDYPLAPGDEIVVTVWGEVELREDYTVNRAGQIYIEKVGVINVAGKSITDVKRELEKLMGKSFSSITNRKSFVDVTVSKLRSIRIFVVGKVKNPGAFVVPAISSPFHALFYAGGITESGSFRQINLVRNDEVIDSLDFYQFLTEGKSFSHLRMQNNDVIVVPPNLNSVELRGAVRQQAQFELKRGEGLVDLIYYSGGITPQSYIDKIRITRFVDQSDVRIYDANLRELVAARDDFPLFDGDRVDVDQMNRELRNIVTISGPIYGPTKFEYVEGMTIRQLFEKVDSLKGDAFLDRIEITRTLPSRKQSVFAVNLKAILDSQAADVELFPEDQISIKSSLNLYPNRQVRILGAVKNPGFFAYKNNMTLKDLIFSAGGFRLNAEISEAEISRVYPVESDPEKLAEILYVKIDSSYVKSAQSPDEEFLLQPLDIVFVRSLSDWEVQRNATISGEVNNPGAYTLKNKRETVYDLIERAGGLKPTAYLKGGSLTRSKGNAGQIGIDFEQIMNDRGSSDNIYLRDGDVVNIPEAAHTVRVEGSVVFPSSILFDLGNCVEDYIDAAGGFTDMADLDHISVTLANGRRIMEKSFLFWSYWPEDLTAGSTIYIPALSEKDDIDWSSTIRDVAAILGSVATTILIIDRLGR